MKPLSATTIRTLCKALSPTFVIVWFLISAPFLQAQDTMQMRLDYWIQVQDSSWMYRITAGGDTLDPEWLSAMYRYEMLYDSICVVTYNFTECKRNGVRLRLPQWKRKRVVNANTSLLGFNSRTSNFPVKPGDTLSFYREFSWYNPQTYWLDSNTYFARDSVDFAVELVNAFDSLRIELLDSIGALANNEPGVPSLHGTRPILALVRYIVPSSISADSAFIRVRPYARGSGSYFFTRHDEVSIGLSKALEDSYWTFLMNRIGQGLGKRVIRTGGGEFESASHVDLDVVQSRVAPDMVQIRFTLPEEEGTVAIVIFNALGEVVFYPYSGSLVGAPALISYQAPRSGTYFAGLVVQGKVLATRKFIISK